MRNLLIALLVLLLSTIHGVVEVPHFNATDFSHNSHTDVVMSFDVAQRQPAGSQQSNIDCSQGCGGIAHFASSCSMIHRVSIILGIPEVSILEDIEWYAKSDVLFSEECKEFLRPPIV